MGSGGGSSLTGGGASGAQAVSTSARSAANPMEVSFIGKPASDQSVMSARISNGLPPPVHD